MDIIEPSVLEKYQTTSFPGFTRMLEDDLTEARRMEIELARQVKYNGLRAELWETAADENLSELELIENLFKLVGQAFDVSKVTYEGLSREKNAYSVIFRWIKPGFEAEKPYDIPLELAQHYLALQYAEFPKDLIPEQKMMAKAIMEASGDKSVLIVPFSDKTEGVNRYFSFCDCETERSWNEFDLSILFELIRIVSQQVRFFKMGESQEMKLKSERKRFYDIIEKIPIIIAQIQRDGIINFVNEKAETEFGYSREEIIGLHFLELEDFSQEERQSMDAAFKELQQGKEVKEQTVRITNRSGDNLILEINAIPMQHHFLMSINNVTEQRRTAEKLQAAYEQLELGVQERTRELQLKNEELNQKTREKNEIEEELRSSRITLRLVIDNIPQFVFWKDRNSVYQGCNRNFSKAAGFASPRDIIGKTDYELSWTKEQADLLVSYDQRIMKNNAPEYHTIEQQQQADGKHAWLDTNRVPLSDWDGEVIGILGSYEDITEDLIAQKKEKEKEQQLLQADKMISLGILASGVAHEINNPNQFIMSHLPPLKRTFEEALPILEKYSNEFGDFRIGGMNYSAIKYKLPGIFNNIMEGSQRIKNIVQELREYIRGYPAEHSETIQFNSVVHSALTLLDNLIKKSTDKFRVEYGRNLPYIIGHYQRLEQVIINLVQNACQALTDNTEAISIRTEFNRKENEILLTIIDEGVGIPEDELDRVTDLFFTTKREVGGIGLGLAISSKIIIEHGGKLMFTPDSKKGTVATVILPVKQEKATLYSKKPVVEKTLHVVKNNAKTRLS